MQPIPEHLACHDWYAAHLAWLVGKGLSVLHDPGGVESRRADLIGADLRGANLRGADLSADLSGADLCYADLRGANLRGAAGVASRDECIARLDEIREHVVEHGDQLNMLSWHGDGWSSDLGPDHACKTSHCLAGWAQALCPDASIRKLDPVDAGVKLIPLAAGRFWDGDKETYEWLKNREYATAED